jgi:hypothetical protein
VGILAIIIFVAANMLSIHAYNIHPTATQTPTPTATVTKTPRPTATPTITAPSTSSPSPTVTPTYLPEFTQMPEIIREMNEKGYLCSVVQSLEGNFGLTCSKEIEQTVFRYRLVMTDGALVYQQILLEPFSTPFPGGVMAEVIWLTQIPIQHAWLMVVSQPTLVSEPALEAQGTPSTITPQVTPTVATLLLDQIAAWLTDSQIFLTPDELIQETFDDLSFTMGISEDNLFVECRPLSVQE